MASVQTVSSALKFLASIWPRDLSEEARDAQLKAYCLALEDLTDAEVRTGAMVCSRQERFFPAPSAIREASRPAIREQVGADAAAAVAFEGILACYERGESVGPRDIRDRWGQEASHAFCCAGGTAAFTWCEPGRDAAFRFKHFVEGYREACEEGRIARAALSAGGDKGLSRGEAKDAMRQITERAK